MRSLRRNSGYTTTLTVLRLGMSVAVVPVLVRALGIGGYGVWAVLLSLLGLASLLELGLSSSVCFHVAHAAEGNAGETRSAVLATSLWLFLGLGSVIPVVLAVGLGPLSGWLFDDAGGTLHSTLLLFGGTAWSQFVRHWIMAAEAGLQRYDVQAVAEGITTVSLYGGLLLLGALGVEMAALAAWFTVASAGGLLVHAYLWKTRIGIPIDLQTGWDRRQARELLGFGLRQWLSQLGGSLFSHMDRIVVNLVLGPAATGIYAAATSVTARINELSAAPVQIVVPAIGATPSDDPARISQIYRNAHHLNMLVAHGLAGGIMLLAEPLARIILPSDPGALIPLLRILALAYGLYSLNAVGFYTAQGLGRPSINARWSLLAGSIFLVGVLFVVHAHELAGVAWANLAFAVTLGINVEVMRSLSMGTELLRTYGWYACSMGGCFLVSSHLLAPPQPLVVTFLIATPVLASVGFCILKSALKGDRRRQWASRAMSRA